MALSTTCNNRFVLWPPLHQGCIDHLSLARLSRPIMAHIVMSLVGAKALPRATASQWGLRKHWERLMSTACINGTNWTNNDKTVLCVIHFTLSEPPYYSSFRPPFYKIHSFLRFIALNPSWRLRISSMCSLLFSPFSPLWFSDVRGNQRFIAEFERAQNSSHLDPDWSFPHTLRLCFFKIRFNKKPIAHTHLPTCVSNERYGSVFWLEIFSNFLYSRVYCLLIVFCHLDLRTRIELI
jgi:hypothetical protein